jgi:HEAT repeat protein
MSRDELACRLSQALLMVVVCWSPATHATAQDRPPPGKVPSLIKDLRAENVEVRRTASAKIRESDRTVQRDALPALIDRLMYEKDGQVRLAVLDAITSLGREAEPAVPALIHTLRTDYGGQRLEETHQDYRSALALAAVGKSAVEGLRGLLNSRKENVRAEAVMALGRIGPDAGAAVPDLILLLGDKNERVRREVSLACGKIGAAAVRPLISACSSSDALIRAAAVESLGHVSSPDPGGTRSILGCTDDADPKVRAAALKALARMNLPPDVLLPSLRENLKHKDEAVRLSVVDLIVARQELLVRMAPVCESLLMGEDDRVARQAAYLLGRLGPDAVPRLIAALRHGNSRIDLIAEALAQTGRSSVEMLTKAVEDPNPRIRRGAALALGQIRPVAPGTVKTLTVGLRDPDTEVRAAFLTAIGELGPRARDAVPAVRDLLLDISAAIRIQAVDVLAHSAPRDDRLFKDLTAMLNDSDARVQRRAIDAIRILGPQGRGALAIVTGKLNSPDREVRLAAADWLGSHGEGAATAVPALISLLNDPSPELRAVAAQTLGKLGKAAQPAFDRLASLLAAEPAKVRVAAVFTLGGLGLDVTVVRPALSKALRDDHPEVRLAAVTAIQRLGPQGSIFIPDLIVLASDKEKAGSVQRLLRRYERRSPDVRALPELVKQLEHDQASVRLLAAKYLGFAGQNAKEAIPALERLRNDPNDDVRKQAAAACERIKSAPATDRQ